VVGVGVKPARRRLGLSDPQKGVEGRRGNAQDVAQIVRGRLAQADVYPEESPIPTQRLDAASLRPVEPLDDFGHAPETTVVTRRVPVVS
jgi:hypothetical protein